jgi:hypothetical protein
VKIRRGRDGGLGQQQAERKGDEERLTYHDIVMLLQA